MHGARSSFIEFIRATVDSTVSQPVAPAAAGIWTWLWWPFQAAQIQPEVLFWATFGTGVGLILQPMGGHRMRSILIALCFILLATATAVVAVQFETLKHLKPVTPLIAFLLAAGIQKFLPAAFDAIVSRIRNSGGNAP